MFSALAGITGLTRTEIIRNDSIKLYKTVRNRPTQSASLAKTHGTVSSIYLLLRLIRPQISFKASSIFISSISASNLRTVSTANAANSSSTASLSVGPATTPSSYFSTIAKVRCNKLPKSLAKSAFIRLIKVGKEKFPSCPNRTSFSK